MADSCSFVDATRGDRLPLSIDSPEPANPFDRHAIHRKLLRKLHPIRRSRADIPR
jgi:hypothetical protein